MHTTRSKDGTSIAFARSGQGPPFVLVHGATSDHTRWAPILGALEKDFTVHAVDRRGRGGSGDNAEHSMEREWDDVSAVVDAIGEPAYLLGHSYGAICSLEAARHTAGVRKLVLYEPPIPTGPILGASEVLVQLDRLLDAGDRAGVVTTFLREVVRMPASELTLLQSLSNWPARVAAAHTIPREMRAVGAYRFDAARFTAFRTPTLLLLGGDSPAYFGDAITQVHAGLPSSRVVVLHGQQHTAINTAPELFVREVVTFLKE
jgi:pimeloyl-ACP methyl ester carboxylesterase